jgi:hypothetical protein
LSRKKPSIDHPCAKSMLKRVRFEEVFVLGSLRVRTTFNDNFLQLP